MTLPRSGLLVALIIAAACGRSGSSETVSRVSPVAAVRRFAVDPSARVYYNDGAGLKDSVRLVVRDAKSWTELWRLITAEESSPPPLPQVDFAQEFLILAAAGRMSPGDQIKIESVAEVGNVLTVTVRVHVECRKFPGTTFPVEVVRLAKTNSRVVFEEARDKSECGG